MSVQWYAACDQCKVCCEIGRNHVLDEHAFDWIRSHIHDYAPGVRVIDEHALDRGDVACGYGTEDTRGTSMRTIEQARAAAASARAPIVSEIEPYTPRVEPEPTEAT